MTCNVIYAVCKAYKSQSILGKIEKDKPIKKLSFKNKAVHFDKRTYSFTKSHRLSLYTMEGRIKVDFAMGEKQKLLFLQGIPKEGELIYRKGEYYFNLVIELPDVAKVKSDIVMGVDVGENNLAATSTERVFGAGTLRDRRDRWLARRKRLQSNGSHSAKQALRKTSGKENRYVRHVNHTTSKAIIAEAQKIGAGSIVLEDLKHIRENIKGNKRIRSRLHRWSFRQLQEMIAYKAMHAGLDIVYVNPAYTSKTCSQCRHLGIRDQHQFRCHSCGLQTHADCNASRNLVWIVTSVGVTRAEVNQPYVGACAL
jgi:IS605 OrfB family transposase